MIFLFRTASAVFSLLNIASAEHIYLGHESVITRDFVIVGGGSSGTYSAFRLRDLNHTVVVVEKKQILGVKYIMCDLSSTADWHQGHCQTLRDQSTGTWADIGVSQFSNFTVVRNYFARLGVPLGPPAGLASLPITTDLRSGDNVTAETFTPAEVSAAIVKYGKIISQWPYLRTGYELPDPIPADLLLSWGDFVEKYSLQALVPLWFLYGQCMGDMLDHTTLSVIKRLGLGVLEGFASAGFLGPVNGCHELYDKALERLGNDVLLGSTIKTASRNYKRGREHVTVVVNTPTGTKTIRAKKIIFTAPQQISNFAGFDLDREEIAVFSKFNYTSYYTAVVSNAGLPNVQVINTQLEREYELPVLPGIFAINPTNIPAGHDIYYGTPDSRPLTDEFVKSQMILAVNKFRNKSGLPNINPEFAIFAGHVPFDMRPSTKDITAGFYKRLNALQGRNNMYYNGAAFHTYDSSALWEFTETLLPKFTEDF
jgi:hypothetical protein